MSDKRVGRKMVQSSQRSTGTPAKTGKMTVAGTPRVVTQIKSDSPSFAKRKAKFKGKSKGKYDKSLANRKTSSGSYAGAISSSSSSKGDGGGAGIFEIQAHAAFVKEISELVAKIKEGRDDEVRAAFSQNAATVADFFISAVNESDEAFSLIRDASVAIAQEAKLEGVSRQRLAIFDGLTQSIESAFDENQPVQQDFQRNGKRAAALVLKEITPLSENAMDKVQGFLANALESIDRSTPKEEGKGMSAIDFQKGLFQYAASVAKKENNRALIPIIFFTVIYGTGALS